MSETKTAPAAGYGYASDEGAKVSPFTFGLNAGLAKLTKFEWIPNGGANGAEGEALDIVFNINGVDKSYRMFPVTKAFDKENKEVTNPDSAEIKDALIDFNARITHILHCFIEADDIKAGFSRPIPDFKTFCQIAMGMLPKDYKEKSLDIFLQYQWQLGEGKERTYLEIPKKMKYGKWLAASTGQKWAEQKVANADQNVREALFYTNEKGEKHPFTKNGWFMSSNFAKQQKAAGAETSAAAAGATQADGAAAASAW